MPETPNVQSFTINDDQGRPLRLTVGTDIIDYVEPARAFGREDLAAIDARGRYQRRMFAVPDLKSSVVSPMVFSVGNQNGLFLIRRQEGGDSTAWKLTDLGKAFRSAEGANPQIRSLGVGWSDDDRITIAVSVDSGEDQAPSRVFVAWNLSSRNTDWDNVPWMDCGTRAGVCVEGIRVVEDERVWTVVLAGDRGADGRLYLLRSNRKTHAFAQALVFTPAVTMEEIYDFQAGVDPATGAGIAIVGKSGRSTVLSFRPFPSYTAEGKIRNTPPTVPLPCPAGARLLERGVTRNGGSDLYIAGEGVHLIEAAEFDNLDQAKTVTVAKPEGSRDAQSLVVADAEDGSASAWTLLRNGDLVVARRKAGEKNWGNSLHLRSGVRDVAPVRGDGNTMTSVLVAYGDGRASFLWQEAAAGTWQETALLVASPEAAVKATCYATSLRVLNESGVPQQGVKVRVSSSVLANVVANRRSVFLGPGVEVETETDFNGGVSVFDRVRSLTPAILRFQVEGVAQVVDVNPAGGIHQRFSTITPDELRAASITAPSGTPSSLLPESFRTGHQMNQLDAVAKSLNQAASLSKGTNGVAGGVALASANAPFSSKLRTDTVPGNYRWGIEADSKGVRTASASTLETLRKAGGSAGAFLVNLGESIADFFESGWNKMKEGWAFLVEKAVDGFNFICKIGDKIKSWVLQTLEQIGSFFVWLWEQLKTALEKLWEWLKFIFNWNDIVRTRDAMVSVVDQALNWFEGSVGGMKPAVEAGFDEIARTIQSWRGAPSADSTGAGKGIVSGAMSLVSGATSVMDRIMGNSAVAWVMSKVQSLLDLIMTVEMPDLSDALRAAARAFQQLFTDSLANATELIAKLAVGVGNLVATIGDVSNLSAEAIRRALLSLGTGVLEDLVTAFRGLALGSLDLLKSMTGICRGLLHAKIRFPLIEQLVKILTLGFVSIDTSFSMMDGLLLLIAIPTTIASKLIFGRPPVSEGDRIVLPFGRVTVSNDAALLKFLPVFLGIAAPFAKFCAGAMNVLEANKENPDWYSVSSHSAAFAVIGFAGEIVAMHFDESATVKGLEATRVTLLGMVVYCLVTGARTTEIKAKKAVARVLEQTSVIYLTRFVLLTAMVIVRNIRTTSETLALSSGLVDDFAGMINSLCRSDKLGQTRIKLLGFSTTLRLANLSLNTLAMSL